MFGPRWSGTESVGTPAEGRRGVQAPRFINRTGLCCADLCQCYGLNEERAKALGREAKRKAEPPDMADDEGLL